MCRLWLRGCFYFIQYLPDIRLYQSITISSGFVCNRKPNAIWKNESRTFNNWIRAQFQCHYKKLSNHFCRCHLYHTKYIELSARQQIAVHLAEKHAVAKLLSSERHSEPPGLSQKILTQTRHIIKYNRHAIISTFSTDSGTTSVFLKIATGRTVSCLHLETNSL